MSHDLKLTAIDWSGSFLIEDAGQAICNVHVKKLFSRKAQLDFHNESLEITPANIWGYKYQIRKNNKPCGDIKISSFRSYVDISLRRRDGHLDHFRLKYKGVFRREFQLFARESVRAGGKEGGHMRHVLTMRGVYNWKRWKYDYVMEEISNKFPREVLHELLIYAGFGAYSFCAQSGQGG